MELLFIFSQTCCKRFFSPKGENSQQKGKNKRTKEESSKDAPVLLWFPFMFQKDGTEIAGKKCDSFYLIKWSEGKNTTGGTDENEERWVNEKRYYINEKISEWEEKTDRNKRWPILGTQLVMN